MNLELLIRRFWWVLLIAVIFLWKNFQRKAEIRDRRRRSAAKARKAKKELDNPTGSSGGRRRTGPKPKKAGKSGKLTKAQFKARMAEGKRKAAARRNRGG